MARTIDDLGLESSSRYAEDQELFDQTLIQEARIIPSQTKITSTLPTYPSEFDALFELEKQGTVWARFLAPPNYYASRRRLFSEQIIPTLGPPDLQETKMGRIEAIGAEEKGKRREEGAPPNVEEELETEKQTLMHLLQNIHLMDELLIDINSRRVQYQKG
ncbi:MAG: hypothetical protein KR126chlam1_00239 [Chlamydiae bacterium]|nr:hypothetical protein [Chlamydiota bacterium]